MDKIKGSLRTSAKIVGGTCGDLWWPVGAKATKYLHKDLAEVFDGYRRQNLRATFRDALVSILRGESGDFQSTLFTADTVVLVHRQVTTREGRTVTTTR